MMRGLEGWHLLIVAGVFAVLFGYKRMPDAARSLGKSMRILKAEVAPLRHDATGPDATGPDATGPDATGPDATGPEAAPDVPSQASAQRRD